MLLTTIALSLSSHAFGVHAAFSASLREADGILADSGGQDPHYLTCDGLRGALGAVKDMYVGVLAALPAGAAAKRLAGRQSMIPRVDTDLFDREQISHAAELWGDIAAAYWAQADCSDPLGLWQQRAVMYEREARMMHVLLLV